MCREIEHRVICIFIQTLEQEEKDIRELSETGIGKQKKEIL